MPLSRKKLIICNILLCGFITLLFLLNFYHRTMFMRPSSFHQWRQTDCLSIAKNYYHEGMNFFQPKIHYQGVAEGKAVSEFPLINYSVAALWKVFGEHEFIYRLFEYLIFLTAIFTLFNTILLKAKSWWLAWLSAGILLTSPLLAYYGLNFLSDVPALSFAIISFCCLFRFTEGKGQSNFYLALLFGMLGVLVKASALVPLCLALLTGVAALAGRSFFRISAAPLLNKWAAFSAMLVVTALVFAWYRYALYYNNHNNSVFLLTVLPLWEMEEGQIIYNLKMLFNNLFPLFLNKPVFFLFLVLVMFVIGGFRRLSRFLKISFIFSALFFVFYLLFFFQVFTVHDYYLINLFIFPVITLICVCDLVWQVGTNTHQRRFMRLLVSLVLLFSSFHSAAVYRLRTIEDDKMVYWFPFISREESDLAKYLFWSYSNNIQRVEQLTPELRKHGIQREDKVLSIPDVSYDVSLYLMDQKGFTLRDNISADSLIMDQYLPRIEYIVLSDTNLKQERAWRRNEHKFKLYFTSGPVQVFKMKNGN